LEALRKKTVKAEKKEKESLSLAKKIRFFFSLLLLIVAALFYMWPQHQMIKKGYEYQKLVTTHERLFQENRVLSLELASMKSLERVEQIAVGKLGFISPDRGQIVYIRDKNRYAKTNRKPAQ
jgi:cell division protein FtsL